jgi:hypothetical protein
LVLIYESNIAFDFKPVDLQKPLISVVVPALIEEEPTVLNAIRFLGGSGSF